MKLHNIIFSVNRNPLYCSYWPIISEVWASFGVIPHLYYLTEDIAKPFSYPSAYGTTTPIPLLENIDEVYQSAMLRFFAAAWLPGNNMVMDIDIFPCNKKFFEHTEALADEASLSIYPLNIKDRLLGWSACSSSQIFRSIFMSVDVDLQWSEKNIRKLEALSNVLASLGKEEIHFYHCVKHHQKQNSLKITYIDYPYGTFIGNDSIKGFYSVNPPSPTIQDVIQRKMPWTFEGLKKQRYWLAHIRRDESKELTKYMCDIVLGRHHENTQRNNVNE